MYDGGKYSWVFLKIVFIFIYGGIRFVGKYNNNLNK